MGLFAEFIEIPVVVGGLYRERGSDKTIPPVEVIAIVVSDKPTKRFRGEDLVTIKYWNGETQTFLLDNLFYMAELVSLPKSEAGR